MGIISPKLSGIMHVRKISIPAPNPLCIGLRPITHFPGTVIPAQAGIHAV